MSDATQSTDISPIKRQRKQVEFFSVPAEKPKEASVRPSEGKGTKLIEHEHFVQELAKIKSDQEIVKALHQLMYGNVGKKTSAKHNIREFSGFPSDVNVEDKVNKVIENKKKWTVSLLKDALGLMALDKTGNREDLCKRMVEYLAAPYVTTASKRARTSKSPKKAKAGKAAKGPKKPRAPTAYILFNTAHRAEVKAANPEATAVEMIKLLSAKWNEASPEEKKKWQDKAAEAKAKLAASGDLAEEEDNEGSADDHDSGAQSDDFAESEEEEEADNNSEHEE